MDFFNTVETVRNTVRSCQWTREQLVWLVGRSDMDRSKILSHLAKHDCISHINVGVELSRYLLDCPTRKRQIRAPKHFRILIDEAVEKSGVPIVALDRIQLLFAPELELNILGLLRSESANRTLIISWCGRVIEENNLVYAEPSHPEYWAESVDHFRVVRADVTAS